MIQKVLQAQGHLSDGSGVNAQTRPDGDENTEDAGGPDKLIDFCSLGQRDDMRGQLVAITVASWESHGCWGRGRHVDGVDATLGGVGCACVLLFLASMLVSVGWLVGWHTQAWHEKRVGTGGKTDEMEQWWIELRSAWSSHLMYDMPVSEDPPWLSAQEAKRERIHQTNIYLTLFPC